MYRIGINPNMALGSLTTLDPQPRSDGVKPTRRSYPADNVIDEGLYVELFWDYSDDASTYQAILSPFGLVAAKKRDITVYARDDLYIWRRYNGLAIRPEPGREVSWSIFARNITVLIKNLVALP